MERQAHKHPSQQIGYHVNQKCNIPFLGNELRIKSLVLNETSGMKKKKQCKCNQGIIDRASIFEQYYQFKLTCSWSYNLLNVLSLLLVKFVVAVIG